MRLAIWDLQSPTLPLPLRLIAPLPKSCPGCHAGESPLPILTARKGRAVRVYSRVAWFSIILQH